MITPKVNGTKVVIGPCRLSYPHLFTKYIPEGDNSGKGKYSTRVLINKTEKETLKAINAAIEAAKQQGIVSKWGGKTPKNLSMPLNDGDDKEDDKEDEACKGCYYLNAKAKDRPGIVDRNKQHIVDEEEMYSGVWAIVSITFFPYDVSGNKGVACGLNNLMKWKDDDHLGGRVSAEADFDGVDTSSEDDEDL